MKVSLVAPGDLEESQLQHWTRLTQSSRDFDSPFFGPSFTQAVARCRKDVEVAVLSQNGSDVGYLPFQRMSRRAARPVGWRINDFQGLISDAVVSIPTGEVMRQCGLSTWGFDHVPLDQTWCRHAHTNTFDSPYIDLSNSYQKYAEAKKAEGASWLKSLERKTRKLEREAEDLRFEFCISDQQVLTRLLEWKIAQLNATGRSTVLQEPWVQGAIKGLHGQSNVDCRGILSALYCGDTLIAAHFGLGNDRVLHWWITAYNRDFERYSPGSILLTRLIDECSNLGLARIDLGKGTERYKRQFMTGSTQLAEGAVASRAWAQTRQRVTYRLAHSARSSPWLNPAMQWMKRVTRGNPHEQHQG